MSGFARVLIIAVLLAGASRSALAELRTPVVAVFELQDATGRQKRLVAGLTDYLRVKLAETRLVKVVDKGDQEAQLKRLVAAERKSSYRTCVDESCQIPLGKELAADRILRGKITRFGKQHVIALEMVELASGASTGAASDKSDGTEESLMASIERVANLITQDLRTEREADAKRAEAAIDAKTSLVAAETAPPAPVLAPTTQAKMVVDDGPSGAELAMIIGGGSAFGVAYFGNIIYQLATSGFAQAYYSLLPIAGPILVETLNKSLPGYDPSILNYVSAGVQLVGAGVGVVGLVLAGQPDEPKRSAARDGVMWQVVVGPTHVGIVGAF